MQYVDLNKITTTEALEAEINRAEEYEEIKFVGVFRYRPEKSVRMLLGRSAAENLIKIEKPNLTLDGSGGKFEIELEDSSHRSYHLFYLSQKARGTRLRNMRVSLRYGGGDTRATIVAVYNVAYNAEISGCDISMESEGAVRFVGVCNDGNLDTHMDTRADNLILSRNRLFLKSRAENCAFPVDCIGFVNYLANSVSLSDNYFFVQLSGGGESHRAIGVYNNGRFLRIQNNNIKANGAHNIGKKLEQATAVAVLNDGLYALISDNNLVAEWAGTAVSVWNRAEFCKVTGNKILSTHTIRGRSVRNQGPKTILSDNILTSTSRNARIVENAADDTLIRGNVLQQLLWHTDAISGAGVYLAGGKRVSVTDNRFLQLKTCGIYAENCGYESRGNQFFGYNEELPLLNTADERDKQTAARLDEKRIASVE